MRKYINKIRAKDEFSRRKILILWMSFSAVFVLSVWVYGLGYRINEKVAKEEAEIMDVQKEEGLKPFALFKNSLSGAINNLTASVGNVPLSLNKSKDKEDKNVIDLIPVEY